MSHIVTKTVENNEFLKRFKYVNIKVTEQDIDEFVAIDDKSSHVFQEDILEEVNLFMKNSKQ